MTVDTFTYLRQIGFSGTLEQMAEQLRRDTTKHWHYDVPLDLLVSDVGAELARIKAEADSTATSRTNTQVFSVIDEGAVGNGTTDDSVAIASAYTKARSVSGTVLFPPGKTYINGVVINPGGTTTQGYGATIKHKPSMTAVNMFANTAGVGARFFGLTIDMNKANTTDPASATAGVGIYLYGAASYTTTLIKDVTINNSYQIGIRLGTGVTITDGKDAPDCATVIENFRSNACKWAIFVSKVGGVLIRGGKITNTATDSIWTNLVDTIKIDGVAVTGSVAGHGIVVQYANDAIVANNTGSGNFKCGIAMGGGDPALVPSLNYTVNNNVCTGNGNSGITTDPTLAGQPGVVIPADGTVNNNICNGNAQHGIFNANARYVTFTGNTCNGNTLNGLSIDSADCTVTGNTATNNLAHGIAFHGNVSYPNYGNHEIGANTVSGNVISQYYFESAYIANAILKLSGTGAPENVYIAPVGSTFNRTDGGAGTSFYVKESGTAATGWVGK